MEAIISTIVKPNLLRRYKRLYFIKDLILELNGANAEDTCKMCFWNCIKYNKSADNKNVDYRKIEFINRYGNSYTWRDLCHTCKKTKSADIECLSALLSLVYLKKKYRFEEIANLLRVKFPYDSALINFISPRSLVHKSCAHYAHYDYYTRTKVPCPIAIELIEKMTNINCDRWINYYEEEYIDYFVARGAKST